MASTWSSGGIDYVAASVSEFTAVIGYCEYEAPMVLQKIKTTPSKAVMVVLEEVKKVADAGLQAHEEEEEYEKEHDRVRRGRITIPSRIQKRLAQLAMESGIINVGAKEENKNPAALTSLAQNVIRPLEDEWGYIRIEKIGRNRWVELTEEGRNVTEFLSK